MPLTEQQRQTMRARAKRLAVNNAPKATNHVSPAVVPNASASNTTASKAGATGAPASADTRKGRAQPNRPSTTSSKAPQDVAAKELLSEMEVVKLLVEKILARSRDGKTTKASALAGGLFQADGRYGDLRPVLLKYEGTIHGFLRHHNQVFTLVQVDDKGRASSDDPIVRVKDAPKQQQRQAAKRPSGSHFGVGGQQPAGHTGGSGSGNTGAAGASAGTRRSSGPPANPWKQIDKPPAMSLGYNQRANHHSSAAAAVSVAAPSRGFGPSSMRQQQQPPPPQPQPQPQAQPRATSRFPFSGQSSPPRSSAPRHTGPDIEGGSSRTTNVADSPLRMNAVDMLPTDFFDG
eukprot:SAG25_NODE_2781_length_1387_cov_1.168478_1_plen_346_part_10